MHRRFHPLFLVGLAFSMGFIGLGFLLSSPAEILRGLCTIMTEQDLLITDYFYLAGIGPALAQRIIDYREMHGAFTKPEDLLEVKGIGEATLEKIRPYIVIN